MLRLVSPVGLGFGFSCPAGLRLFACHSAGPLPGNDGLLHVACAWLGWNYPSNLSGLTEKLIELSFFCSDSKLEGLNLFNGWLWKWVSVCELLRFLFTFLFSQTSRKIR